MKVYGLSARGDSLNGWRFRMMYAKVFLTPERAEKDKQIFFDKCCDPSFLECADPATLAIFPMELELIEE